MAQRILLCLLACVILQTFVMIRRLIVKPLRVQCKAIENLIPQPATGAYELQSLIQAYYRKLNLMNTAKRRQEQNEEPEVDADSMQTSEQEGKNEQI